MVVCQVPFGSDHMLLRRLCDLEPAGAGQEHRLDGESLPRSAGPGWKFDRDGDKADVFSFVLFSLEASRGGLVRVCNTAKRCDELVGQIDAILAAGKLHRKDGLVLRGRLAFADAQVFGRAGRKCLQAITKHT